MGAVSINIPNKHSPVSTRGAPLKIESVQAGARIERHASNAEEAAGKRDGSQGATALERIFRNAADAVGERVAAGPALRILNERGLALVE